jgi:valyl-tRNA synthetase
VHLSPTVVGHQIPAWYAVSETGGQLTDATPFVVARSEAEAQEKAISQFGSDVKLKQDPDVLDTWFSLVCGRFPPWAGLSRRAI